MTIDDKLVLGSVKLSVVRALLGEITPAMRAVTVELNAELVTIRVYHDGVASDELWADLDAASTAVHADLPERPDHPVSVQLSLLRCDEPHPIPTLGEAVFSRKGVQHREWKPSDPF
ncbi:MAG: hypothetical protein ABI969_01640 [bacterium]